MLESSQDILNIVLAGAIVLVAIFIAWMCAEAAWLIHQANRLVHETRKKITSIERALVGIKDKLEHSIGYLAVLSTGVKAVLETVVNKPKRRKKK